MATRQRASLRPHRKRTCPVPGCGSQVINLDPHYRSIHRDTISTAEWQKLKEEARLGRLEERREANPPKRNTDGLTLWEARKKRSIPVPPEEFEPVDMTGRYTINRGDSLPDPDRNKYYDYAGTPPLQEEGLTKEEKQHYRGEKKRLMAKSSRKEMTSPLMERLKRVSRIRSKGLRPRVGHMKRFEEEDDDEMVTVFAIPME